MRVAWWIVGWAACGGDGPVDGSLPDKVDTDTDTDTDIDTDIDIDTDTDTDTADTADTDSTPVVHDLMDVSDATLVGENATDWLGRAVVPVGDQDGDGFDDLVVAALWNDEAGDDAGAAYVVLGPMSPGRSEMGAAYGKITGEQAHDAAGVSLAPAGDVNGDGVIDLFIGADGHDAGAPNRGAVYLVHGPLQGPIPLGTAQAKWLGENRGDLAGVTVANAGDMDGDGTDELVIGARYNDMVADDAGAAYIIDGSLTGVANLDQARAKILGIAAGDWAGIHVTGAGDHDGDGLTDLLVSARLADGPGGIDAGASYLMHGPVDGLVSLAQADATFEGLTPLASTSRVAGEGDVDGDGRPDVLIGSRFLMDGGLAVGGAYLVLAPATGNVDLAGADATLVGVHEDSYAGFRTLLVPDLDGDGFDEVLLGAFQDDQGGPSAGAAYLFYGPVVGTVPLDLADVTWIGETGSWLGFGLNQMGDLSGDGVPDLVLGAPAGEDLTDPGTLHVIFGGGVGL